MRTIPFASLCLISAMIALAQSPARPRLHWPAAPGGADAALLQLAQLKSMPSGGGATQGPRRTWHTNAPPTPPCPFHSAKACAAWQNGR